MIQEHDDKVEKVASHALTNSHSHSLFNSPATDISVWWCVSPHIHTGSVMLFPSTALFTQYLLDLCLRLG